jgi:hypothetical protein
MVLYGKKAGALFAVLLAAGSSAAANPVTYSFGLSSVSGHAGSAAVTFDSSGGTNTMVVTLTNTIGSAINSLGSRALTGMFFDVVGDPTIGTNASVTGTMIGAQPGESTNPTDYWAFRENLDSESAMPASFGGARYGLSAAGFGVFGLSSILGTPTAANQPNGLDGGILSATGNAYTGQNQTPLVRTSAVFTFILSSTFFDNGYVPVVENVSFQFGSGFNEPSLHLIPLPGAAGLAVVGLGFVAIGRRR